MKPMVLGTYRFRTDLSLPNLDLLLFLPMAHGRQDLSSLTRDGTYPAAVEVWCPNH